MKTTLFKAETRGHADHGWLNAYHSFSFASYYNPAKMGFGLLRVLNDDTVQGGSGFGMHGHDNMEIVTIPLKGQLEHQDSMGNKGVIRAGEVQIMSAGTGIRHSEANPAGEPVNLLQIWVEPKKQNIKPRYDQKTYLSEAGHNQLYTIVSPTAPDALWINQDAYFNIGKFDKDLELIYTRQHSGNGFYLFVIEGEVKTAGEVLSRRDALGVQEAHELVLQVSAGTELLLIDVPMN